MDRLVNVPKKIFRASPIRLNSLMFLQAGTVQMQKKNKCPVAEPLIVTTDAGGDIHMLVSIFVIVINSNIG